MLNPDSIDYDHKHAARYQHMSKPAKEAAVYEYCSRPQGSDAYEFNDLSPASPHELKYYFGSLDSTPKQKGLCTTATASPMHACKPPRIPWRIGLQICPTAGMIHQAHLTAQQAHILSCNPLAHSNIVRFSQIVMNTLHLRDQSTRQNSYIFAVFAASALI